MMRGVTQNGLWLNVFDNDFIIEDIKNETMLTLWRPLLPVQL